MSKGKYIAPGWLIKFCLVFEDDFIITKNSKTVIKEAVKFINDNYSDVDILFLHNIRINTGNNINTDTFTNGHGLGSHAYFITRHFIESIISKYGRLPKANGQHLDFELNIQHWKFNIAGQSPPWACSSVG